MSGREHASRPQVSCKWPLPPFLFFEKPLPPFQILWVGRDRDSCCFFASACLCMVLHAERYTKHAEGEEPYAFRKRTPREGIVPEWDGLTQDPIYPSTFWDRQGARHKFAWILAMSCHAISLRPNSKAMTMTSHSIVTQRFSIFQFRHVQISMFQSLIHSIRRGRGPRTNQTVKENSEPWARPRKEGFRFDDNVALNNQQHRNCSKFIPRYQHGETEERHAEHPGL